MNMTNTKTSEKKFHNALQNIFVGAKVDGRGGFINLMQIKSNYYEKIAVLLEQDIYQALQPNPRFRNELFDKLYSFFSRYFTQNGSICFNDTAFHNSVYEKVYTNEKDVVLFWKTQMLYYVKTDSLYQSMPVEFDRLNFYFNASDLTHKQANEKKALVFTLKEDENDSVITFTVSHSQNGNGNGNGTKTADIVKALKKKDISITEVQLEKAFNTFKRQSEVDYFINKNAKHFLQEQFKLWSYQYFWDGAQVWDSKRVNELQILKNIAFKIIDFISQFEDELVKIWNKPKFVKNSNYVITLDRLPDEIVKKIKKAAGYKDQVEEWNALGIDKNNLKAPIDTKHFKNLELDILARFDNLDDALDGWLIKSENYQALNTILPKFKEKVQCIYIDPPFNTGNDFEYVDKFQDSTWLSLIKERIHTSKFLLDSKSGNFFLHLDMNANYYGRQILNEVFGEGVVQNEIIWHYKSFHGQVKNYFPKKHDTIAFCRLNDKAYFELKRNEDVPIEELSDFNNWGKYIVNNNEIRGNNMPTDVRFKRNLDKWIKQNGREPNEGDVVYVFQSQTYDDVWDIPYLDPKNKTERIGYDTQKPETLIKRILDAVVTEGDLVADYFVASGTTIATAHKMGMRWLGVESNDVFYEAYEAIKTFKAKKKNEFEIIEIIKENETDITALVRLTGCLGRMKKVLSGFNAGISEQVNFQGGGFFKYYELEQYEETLNNCKYEDGNLMTHTDKSIYEQYVFLADEKMLGAIEPDYENNKVKVDLSTLYKNIDVAETLSNLTGKGIKTIQKDKITFADGTEVNPTELDYKLIKPLIWWGHDRNK